MADEPHPLDLNATLERIEPGVSPLPADMALTSIAISLARIANSLKSLDTQIGMMQGSQWGNTNNIVSAINSAASKIRNG